MIKAFRNFFSNIEGYLSFYVVLFFILSTLLSLEIPTDRVNGIVLILWLITMLSFNTEARVSFFTGFVFLILTIFYALFDITRSEQTSIFLLIFMTAGCIQYIWEAIRKPKNQITFKPFIVKVFMLDSTVYPYINAAVFQPLLSFIGTLLEDVKVLVNRIIQNRIVYHIKKGHRHIRLWILGYVSMLLLIITCLSILLHFMYQQHLYSYKTSRSFFITEAKPERVIYGTEVVIKGHNFNWIGSTNGKILTSYGEVIPSNWTNTEIKFVIPLKYKTGPFKLWLEREYSGDDPRVIKSNEIILNVLSREQFYPSQDSPLWQRTLRRLERYIYFELQ